VELDISVKGSVNSKKIKEKYNIPLKISFISCKRCNLQDSKYYEAILQIRPSSEKVEKCVKDLISKRKDVHITQEKSLKEGKDFYITSQKYARLLVSNLKDKFKGEVKITKKLFSQRKDGKKIYRSTFLFRLPEPL
jgi:NMD protein affecting ribosome stability and mRNA decay